MLLAVQSKAASTPRKISEIEIESWIKNLAGEDEKLAGSARRRLVLHSGRALAPLWDAVRKPKNTSQFRGVLRVLGDIPFTDNRPFKDTLRAFLVEQLKVRDNAERRSVINCLGRLGVDAQAESALLEIWKAEKRPDQLRVLAGALGRVGGSGSEKALRDVASNDALVQREVANARAAIDTRRSRADLGEGRVRGDLPLRKIPVRLRCRRGLCGLLVHHLPKTICNARETGPGQVDGELNGTLNSLLDCRLWSEAVLLVNTSENAASPRAFASALLQCRDLVRELTEGAPTWRLHLPEASRGQLLDLIHAAQKVAPDFPNSPQRAVWELRTTPHGLEVRPRFWPDTRFDYLQAEVPAMTHAPLAAALASLSEPRPDDLVWDPFCGAGTELAERAKAAPYGQLFGTDRDPMAIRAAAKNLHGIKNLILAAGDALEWPYKNVNVVLTNPPYGRKVQGGHPAQLLRVLLEQASRHMRRGRIVLCSPMPQETWEFARRLGWSAISRHDVSTDAHPVEAQLFVRG